MSKPKIFRFSEISRLLTGDRTNIRSNYKGDKYHDAINELKEFEKHWKAKYLTGLKNKTLQDIQRKNNIDTEHAVKMRADDSKNKYELHKDKFDDLDDLMQFILDDLVEKGDKKLIRNGIIMYAEQWHDLKKSYDNE